jgi:hypothetical protein
MTEHPADVRARELRQRQLRLRLRSGVPSPAEDVARAEEFRL